MDSRLQAYLDGEIALESLPPDLREEAAGWSRLVEELRAGTPAGAPLGFEQRVMSALSSPEPRGRPGWLDWLLRPRTVSVRPVAAVALAVLLAAVSLFVARPGGGPAESRVYVQFVVDAPQAESVHVVGDFTEWQPTIALEDADGDGTWSGRVPLLPGVHEYMFVIDGSDWVTDPNAAGYQDDGFGQRNAVVAVSGLNGT